MQVMINEIEQLKHTVLQRNQVILIKDQTIAQMKNDYGMRSSTISDMPSKAEGTKEVACLAIPDVKDAKCQTHGPRKQAYYRSIPAKVRTNLPDRSGS